MFTIAPSLVLVGAQESYEVIKLWLCSNLLLLCFSYLFHYIWYTQWVWITHYEKCRAGYCACYFVMIMQQVIPFMLSYLPQFFIPSDYEVYPYIVLGGDLFAQVIVYVIVTCRKRALSIFYLYLHLWHQDHRTGLQSEPPQQPQAQLLRCVPCWWTTKKRRAKTLITSSISMAILWNALNGCFMA